MSGEADNASNWPDADVWIAPLGTELPEATAGILEDPDPTTAYPAGWELVGLLDGDNGFVQSREEEKNDFYAWGGALVRTTRRNFKQTVTFTALEDNNVTRDLIWPGSDVGEIVVPRPIDVLIAFELREGDKIKRLISADHAQVEINGDIVDNEADLTRYELIATIFPDTSVSPYVLFYEQKTEAGS